MGLGLWGLGEGLLEGWRGPEGPEPSAVVAGASWGCQTTTAIAAQLWWPHWPRFQLKPADVSGEVMVFGLLIATYQPPPNTVV